MPLRAFHGIIINVKYVPCEFVSGAGLIIIPDRAYMGKMQRILQQRIYIIAVIVCAVFLLASVLFLRYAVDENKKETRAYMQEVAQQSKMAVDKQVQGDFQTLDGIAGIIGSMDDPDFEALLPVLDAINRNNTFVRMGFTDRDGITNGVDISGVPYYNVDLQDKDFVDRAYAGENVITKTQKAEIGDFWVNYFAVPIWHNGEVVKVLCAVNEASILSNIVDTSMFNGKGYASIISDDGTYVIRSTHPSVDQGEDALNIFTVYPFEEDERVRLKAGPCPREKRIYRVYASRGAFVGVLYAARR